MIKSLPEGALLGFLAHGPMSGYDLKRRAEVSISAFGDIQYSQIYPLLRRMQGEGLVTGTPVEGDSRGKNVYSLTEAGREALRLWLLEDPAEERLRFEMMVKLFFGAAGDPVRQRLWIEDFRRRHEKNLELLKLFEAQLQMPGHESEDHRHYLMLVRFGIHTYSAFTAWAEEALALLK